MVINVRLMTDKISSSLSILRPGKYSGPERTETIASLWKASRMRLYVATATFWSVSVSSQFGLMIGGSAMSDELMVTLPRDVGATGQLTMDPYCPVLGCCAKGSEKLPTKADATRYYDR